METIPLMVWIHFNNTMLAFGKHVLFW